MRKTPELNSADNLQIMVTSSVTDQHFPLKCSVMSNHVLYEWGFMSVMCMQTTAVIK